MYSEQFIQLSRKRLDWETEEEVRLGWITELQNTLGIASCEFHCFSTSSAEFQSVARSAYSGGALDGNMISV